MTRSSLSNHNAKQDYVEEESTKEQNAKNFNKSKSAPGTLFNSPIGKRNYEKTDAAKVYGELMKQWRKYREEPTEENKNNLLSPLMPTRRR